MRIDIGVLLSCVGFCSVALAACPPPVSPRDGAGAPSASVAACNTSPTDETSFVRPSLLGVARGASR